MLGIITLVLTILFLLGGLFSLQAYNKAQVRKRDKQVADWHTKLRARNGATVAVERDNAVVLWPLRDNPSLYMVAHYVCDYQGENYELSSISARPYREALDVFESWAERMHNGEHYRSGLLYPVYKDRKPAR